MNKKQIRYIAGTEIFIIFCTLLTIWGKRIEMLLTPFGIINIVLCVGAIVGLLITIFNRKLVIKFIENWNVSELCWFLISFVCVVSVAYGFIDDWRWIIFVGVFVVAFIILYLRGDFSKNKKG